jgi:PPM family protein phosphatase
MDGTHYLEIRLTHQQTQATKLLYLGGLLEHGEADWVLDQTGMDYSRLRFVQGSAGVTIQRIEGDSVLTVNGAPLQPDMVIDNGALLAIDADVFKCEIIEKNLTATQPVIDAGWRTITGSVRPHNEDAIGIYNQPPYHLYVVADGVGGAEAGELISEFAVKYLLDVFGRSLVPGTNWSQVLQKAVTAINSEARAWAQRASQRSGKRVQAGSTLTALVINGWEAYTVHVGDSRLYHLRNGHLEQRTEDHSTFPQDRSDPNVTKRNVLVKGIGKTDDIFPDIERFQLQPGDRLLLCSDGMSDRITDVEITTLIESMSPAALASHLAKMADDRRSGDNVSVIALHIATQANPNASGVQPNLAQPRAFIGPPANWTPHLPQQAALPDENTTIVENRWLSLNTVLVLAALLGVLVIVGLVLAQMGAA